jgi:DNA-binding MarR family transcriptional regulator
MALGMSCNLQMLHKVVKGQNSLTCIVTGVSSADDVRRFVERFALLMADAGMPRMAARVFARLLVEDSAEMTAGELADRLQVSPAAVSGAVRYLVQVHMVERHRHPGARADHYRLAGGDLWTDMLAHRMTAVAGWEAAMADGAAVMGPATPAGRRLRENEAFFAFLRQEIPAVLARWRQVRDGAATTASPSAAEG